MIKDINKKLKEMLTKNFVLIKEERQKYNRFLQIRECKKRD